MERGQNHRRREQRGGKGIQSKQNVPSAGLLIKGMVGAPPETGVAGTKRRWGGPFLKPPSPWGALINGALVLELSTLTGMIKDGGDGRFCEGGPEEIAVSVSWPGRDRMRWGVPTESGVKLRAMASC